MTMADFGPERPGAPSETREWADRDRRRHDAQVVSNRRFLIFLSLLVIALALFFILRA